MKWFLVIILALLSEALLAAVPVCKEETVTLLEEFVPTDFDKHRKTVGKDQVDPLIQKASTYILNQPDTVVSQIFVSSQVARAPYYTTVGKKRVLDPKSDEINANLARQRAEFAQTALIENFKMKKISIVVESKLAGPEFSPFDLNLRFVTPETQGYKEQLEKLAKDQKIDLKELEKETNLYHAKFKPFQGFRMTLTGYKKCLTQRPALSRDHQVKTR
jgi:hypothetical protein